MIVRRYRRRFVVIGLYVAFLIYAMAAEAEVIQEQAIEESISSEGVSLLEVEAVSGNIRISSWERSEVLVKAIKRVSADTNEDAQEFLDKVVIQVENAEGKIKVKTKQPVLSTIVKGANISVEYNISTPEDMSLDIDSKSGSIYVVGNRGMEKITTMGGNIELKNIAGSVSAKTSSGDIYAEILFDDESSFFTIDGTIEVYIGDDFSVPVSARTVSGSINIIIPEGYSADVDASAISGTVTCEIPFDGDIKGSSLRGRIFGGGPPMKLNTITGNITIIRTLDAPIEQSTGTAVLERELPKVDTIKTSIAPKIDGKLDDECWKKAGRIQKLVSADGLDLADESTEAYLLWDDENLYIGVKCYESRMEMLTIKSTERDKTGWDEDMVQIFIDPAPDPKGEYYHISMNPIGTVHDQKADSNFSARRWNEWSGRGFGWNSSGLFDTDIRGNFWSVELGIPFSDMGAIPQEGDVWRFNLYRMQQYRKEHTYWSPTFNDEDWPHIPSRFGGLIFAAEQPAEEIPSEEPTPTEKDVSSFGIIIEGNEKISQEEIMEALKLETTGLPGVDALTQAKSRLYALGWFQDVGMELTESDKGVNLIVKVTERKIVSPSSVEIRGSELFSEKQIIEYFNFTTDRTTMHEVKIRCKLIEELLRGKGYDMATVSCSFVSGTLIIDVKGGRIDKIVVIGNKRTSEEDILDALDMEVGAFYRRDEIDNAVRIMKDRLPQFSKVSWDNERTDDGLNLMYIRVIEEPGFSVHVNGVGEFNRVHGLHWGLRTEQKSRYAGLNSLFEFRYGFSSKIWDYQFGVEKSFFKGHGTSIGIDVHKLTDTNDWELVSDSEHFIAEAILGEAWRDFYQRKGYELSLGQRITSSTKFDLKYRDDKYRSLEKTNDWSLLDRAYEDDDWSDEFRWTGGRKVYRRADVRDEEDDEKQKPDNPPILEGKMRSLIAEYNIDTRNDRKNPTNGWLNSFSFEHAGLDSDYDFNLYKANIRRYNRLGGNQFLLFRVKAATADRSLPTLHPRKLYLGGIGTLRGYRFKEFHGDKMLLLNAEYWIMVGFPHGIGIVLFADSGFAWPYDIEIDLDDMKTNVGIGFKLGALRVNLASPVKEDDKETIFSARLARMF